TAGKNAVTGKNRISTGETASVRLHRARRCPSSIRFRLFFRFIEIIPDTALGQDVLAVGRVPLEFFPDPPHGHVDSPHITVVLVAPDLFQEGLPGEYLSRLHGKELDQFELPQRQLDDLAVPLHLVPVAVDHKVFLLYYSICPCRSNFFHSHPPDVRLYPGHQLPLAERLRDIVVSAQFEAEHLVHLFFFRRQHYYRRGEGLPQLPADSEAVHFREHHVQKDQIRVLAERELHRLLAVKSLDGGEAFFFEIEFEDVNYVFFIVYDQDLLTHKI